MNILIPLDYNQTLPAVSAASQFNIQSANITSQISMGTLNIMSISTNITTLHEYITLNHLDVTYITESWA